MKALFLVNPTNPTSKSLSSRTVNRIRAIVHKSNPNLIILADNVYAPFVKEFNTLMNVLPRNTIGVYSFSKYFGSTGWRLGCIALHKTNIIDRVLLKEMDQSVHDRYKMISIKPEKIKFIDRLLIDSRQVAEAHTAGLSTPQQVMMCLFAVYDLIDTKRVYNKKLKVILEKRMKDLLHPISYKVPDSDLDSSYYIILNIVEVVRNLAGSGFANYINDMRDPLEFLMRLAKDYGVVLLSSIGFGGPFWGVRVSLANLATEDYAPIGESLRSLIDEYYAEFKTWRKKNKDK